MSESPHEHAPSSAGEGFAGSRKLVRPVISGISQPRRASSPLLAHQDAGGATANATRSSHAEVFYFQKQIQTHTPMVFVLEDGERIEGVIEWYDALSIKVRNSTRVLIYKSGIKYLYKAGEAHP